MSRELEAATADAVTEMVRPKSHFTPPPGAVCANCGAPLQGPYCHSCGQSADTHHRSIFHLAWEAIEGLFHLDGRLVRTLPALFFAPGRLARDYLEGRVARHVPPFRTFLVALLLFIFAAEHAIHLAREESEHHAQERSAALATAGGREKAAAELRAEAAKSREEALAEAASDRTDDLKDADIPKAKTEARYAKAVAEAQSVYQAQMATAALIAGGKATPGGSVFVEHSQAQKELLDALDEKTHEPGDKAPWLTEGLRKAVANPDYYLNVVFTWGHRLAVLLLPIVGLALATVYLNRREYYLYDHLLVAMNLLSFAFLTNALGLVLPHAVQGWWFGLVTLWNPVNLFQTLRGAYGSSVLGAVLKTFIVWMATVVSFSTLLVVLIIFSLGQL